MLVNKHNIPIATPKPVKKKEQIVAIKTFLHPDALKFNTFATLTGEEDGCTVHVMTPVAHPDFKATTKAGLRVTERWERGDGRYGQ